MLEVRYLLLLLQMGNISFPQVKILIFTSGTLIARMKLIYKQRTPGHVNASSPAMHQLQFLGVVRVMGVPVFQMNGDHFHLIKFQVALK